MVRGNLVTVVGLELVPLQLSMSLQNEGATALPLRATCSTEVVQVQALPLLKNLF